MLDICDLICWGVTIQKEVREPAIVNLREKYDIIVSMVYSHASVHFITHVNMKCLVIDDLCHNYRK